MKNYKYGYINVIGSKIREMKGCDQNIRTDWKEDESNLIELTIK